MDRNGKKLLDSASQAINDRGENYDTPERNFTRIAKLWSVVLGKDSTALEVGLCMDLEKTARLISTPNHYDSLLDKAGYVACMAELKTFLPCNQEKD